MKILIPGWPVWVMLYKIFPPLMNKSHSFLSFPDHHIGVPSQQSCVSSSIHPLPPMFLSFITSHVGGLVVTGEGGGLCGLVMRGLSILETVPDPCHENPHTRMACLVLLNFTPLLTRSHSFFLLLWPTLWSPPINYVIYYLTRCISPYPSFLLTYIVLLYPSFLDPLLFFLLPTGLPSTYIVPDLCSFSPP